MRIKKSKIFKTISFSSLALLMGIAGTMAFAPLGATAPLASANEIETTTTSGLGLDPKNDPVVYTTESGLEIKMSNATNKYSGTTTVTTNNGNTHTQDLTSFYYFTMGTYSGTIYTAKNQTDSYSVSNEPVNWIILGLGSNTGYFLDTVSANLFSTWKTNASGLSHDNSNDIGGSYFFKEIFESTTPAGSAINGVVPSKSYVMEKVKASITTNSEIPDGCMLVLSEKLLGQMYFNATGNLNTNLVTTYSPTYFLYGTGYYGNRYRYIANSNVGSSGTQTWTISGNAGGSLYNYINNLFSKTTSGTILKNGLGFTQAQADLIVPQQLYTHYSNGSSNFQETPSTDGGTYYTMFPLAYRAVNTSISQNFCIEDYLANANQRVAVLIGSTQCYFWETRSGRAGSGNAHWICDIQPNGNYMGTDCKYVDNTAGVRPAMVMKLQ